MFNQLTIRSKMTMLAIASLLLLVLLVRPRGLFGKAMSVR